MSEIEQERRSFFFTLAALSISQLLPKGIIEAQTEAPQGYVLGEGEGEQLVHFRDHGKIVIKVGTATGSESLAMGTQQVMARSGIPVHRHFQMDEAFYVVEGSGTFTLNDAPHPFEHGATIYIPRRSWHGFANPDHDLLLLWIVSPAGLDLFFRETCTAPGAPPKNLTRAQIREIAQKYATEFR